MKLYYFVTILLLTTLQGTCSVLTHVRWTRLLVKFDENFEHLLKPQQNIDAYVLRTVLYAI